MRFCFALIALLGMATAIPTKIDPGLTEHYKFQKTCNIAISFVGGNTKAINTIASRSFQSRTRKINFLVNSLQNLAQASQRNLISFLKSKSASYKAFWISNQIYVFNASKALVQFISKFPEVELIEKEPVARIDGFRGKLNSSRSAVTDPGWNIQKIQAHEAWAISNGNGIIVANTDTGVRQSHEALRDNHRAEYGWYDPWHGSATPNDDNSHGTHTMGTIAGSGGIGVAPGARWIACKGCDQDAFCTGATLVGCGQWMLCPTLPDGSNPDCSMAPNLVSNSWGYADGNNPYYRAVADAWNAAGIIGIFSIGNSGPDCGTVRSPGDMDNVIAVGATNENDQITDFSSIGPTADGRIKPGEMRWCNVSAPGENIRSAQADSDTSYGYWWGTSMAAPHVSGVVALLLSVDPGIGFEQMRSIIQTGVDTNLGSQGRSCGGVGDSAFPNYHFGFGRTNALKVWQKLNGN